jgi:hypothetical protein
VTLEVRLARHELCRSSRPRRRAWLVLLRGARGLAPRARRVFPRSTVRHDQSRGVPRHALRRRSALFMGP